MAVMPLFHPVVSGWFERRFGEPTEPQALGWPRIQSGRNVLICAPTGSGKTLAAFLSAIDKLVRQGLEERLENATEVLYISPLKALANDVRHNLLTPLEQIRQAAAESGLDLPEIRPLVRTGDTPAAQRRSTLDRPPHILVTTPESFFILLTSQRGAELLKRVRTVIVDEIHSLAGDKRGSHLSLSLERLAELAGKPVQRIGLSATQKPIEDMASFLSGNGRETEVVDVGHRRDMDLGVEVVPSRLTSVATHEIWDEVHERLAELIHGSRTTLVFVNTRRMAERTTHRLAELVGRDLVATHHGSLARETRLAAEKRLKAGELKAVVATASLELGIDIGSVDLVCQLGSPRSIALALQRIGRSGHWKGATPAGRLFATTRDELLECAALVHAIRAGELDRIRIPECPLDVLAQQLVAAAAGRSWPVEDLFHMARRAHPYRHLDRSVFDAVVEILAEGLSTSRGRLGAYLHHDRVNGLVRGRRGARLAAITSGGAIPENANYAVKADPDETIVGDVDEDFAVESMRGDIFLLGNTSWRIRRIEAGVVRVEDARGAPPTIPFWRGEAPGRTDELSREAAWLRCRIAGLSREEATGWLTAACGLDRWGAVQAAEYVRAGMSALGAVPAQDCVIAERFFDEVGGMQLVIHAPFGSRINKAWGLALRKRFCRSFNFELQAAATEDGLVISLSDQHSFPLEAVFSFLRSDGVRDLLIQALLGIPLFGVRWRWTATRALAVLRFRGGRRVAPFLQRMQADDLLANIFPQQAACLENIVGDIEVPRHPLVDETLKECLTDALDIEGLSDLLGRIEGGRIRCRAVETPEPSPFAQEIVNAAPYAFLDDAPLEERRTRAVQMRSTVLSAEDRDLGVLEDQVIRQVEEQVRPKPRDIEELHDVLLTFGLLPEEEIPEGRMLEHLVAESRTFLITLENQPGRRYAVAAERLHLVRTVFPASRLEPRAVPEKVYHAQWARDMELDREQAIAEIVRSRMAHAGPRTTAELSQVLGLTPEETEVSLFRLEAGGQILRGRYRLSSEATEWCDRSLLARMRRLTLDRLRREIEPVSPAQFMRFLFRWQHVVPENRFHGLDGTDRVLQQLRGYEAAAAAWESQVLPSRIADYRPEYLDQLCLSGAYAWGRLSRLRWENSDTDSGKPVRPSRLAPIAFLRRTELQSYLESIGGSEQDRHEGRDSPCGPELTHPAREVLQHLETWGASFFVDIAHGTGRLPVEVESALWELVAAGLVTADGFGNLRALMDRQLRQAGNRRLRKKLERIRSLSAGRWSLLRPVGRPAGSDRRPEEANPWPMQLLQRWGVVFKDLLVRESAAPGWRDLVTVYRRLEARGQVRGGRFVSGGSGEQFALPLAVDLLRQVRRSAPAKETVRISSADPLNLQGIILPGARIRPSPDTMIIYVDGVPVEESETQCR